MRNRSHIKCNEKERKMFKKICFVLVFLCAVAFSGNTQATIIDSFEDEGFISVSSTGTSSTVVSDSTPFGDIMGGLRVMELNITGKLYDTTYLGSSLGSYDGSLVWSNDAGVSSEATLIWAPLGGVDLTEAGLYDSFFVDVTFADNLFDIMFEVNDTVSSVTALSSLSGGPGIVRFEFSDFSNYGNVNWESIDSISMTLTGAPGVDVALEIVTTNPIPEPATMVLLGCGLIGLAGLGRTKFMRK
jgi:hypothetical protein